MDRVGSGVWGNGAGAGNEAVDNGVEIGIGICTWWGEMNEAASVGAALVFAAVFRGGGMGWAQLKDEGEGPSTVKLLSAGWTPKEVEGGGLEGANRC
jgi:hypothetical protein